VGALISRDGENPVGVARFHLSDVSAGVIALLASRKRLEARVL
jgi:hypothetical protein